MGYATADQTDTGICKVWYVSSKKPQDIHRGFAKTSIGGASLHNSVPRNVLASIAVQDSSTMIQPTKPIHGLLSNWSSSTRIFCRCPSTSKSTHTVLHHMLPHHFTSTAFQSRSKRSWERRTRKRRKVAWERRKRWNSLNASSVFVSSNLYHFVISSLRGNRFY